MTILSIGNFTTSWDSSICDEEHIAKALEDLGHTVVRLQRENINMKWEYNNYDFVLIAQWNGYPPDLIRHLRHGLGTRIVYWAFDYQYDKNGEPCPEDWHIRLVKETDLFLSKELEHKSFYESLAPGVKFRWLPQDFAPEFLGKVVLEDTRYDVVFTGSHLPWSPERTEFLKEVDKHFDLHVFSVTPEQWAVEGIKNSHGPIMDEGLKNLYAQSKIVLSYDWKQSMGYWSDRNAQIMACGGFTLFKYVPMSEGIFQNGVAYFYNTEDALQKIQHYLDNEKEREQIAAIGYAIAQTSLKVSYRVQQMLTIIGELL